MADCLQFHAKPRAIVVERTYQVHAFAPDGGVRTSRVIAARDDADAIRQARDCADRHRVELWSTSRFVAQFARCDVPYVAAMPPRYGRPTIVR